MTLTHGTHDTHGTSATDQRLETLLTQLQAGSLSAAVTFAGNGTPWLSELQTIVGETPQVWQVIEAVSARLDRFSHDQRVRWAGGCPQPFDLAGWVRGTRSLPSQEVQQSSAVSQPAIFAAQIARWMQLNDRGLTLDVLAKTTLCTSGYSQGIMAATWLSEACGRGDFDLNRVADYAEYLAWQGLLMSQAWRDACVPAGELPPMVAISGPTHAELLEVLGRVKVDGDFPAPVTSMANSRTRHVVSGTPASLKGLELQLDKAVKSQQEARKGGKRGGAVLQYTFDPLPVEGAYHSAFMTPGVAPMREAMSHIGFALDPKEWAFPVLDSETGEDLRASDDALERLIQLQYVCPVNWSRVTQAIGERQPQLVLDYGAGAGIANVTSSGLRGRGVRTLPLSSPAGRATLCERPAAQLPAQLDYRSFAPGLVKLPSGDVRVDNLYTRATGHSPAILPGMTPTTGDVPIVAAAANAGHTAELAGGGQVTERIFELRMEELRESLEPGAEVTFNALFMDRYLWGLHLGGAKLVQKARKAGTPISGVTISAGIPDAEEGARLLDEFTALGMYHNTFKPGTVKQVDAVLAIADKAPQHTVFLHLEGGKAGGHHSWEDLDDLLIRCYDRIRQRANVVLCVGGGIADEERSTALLTGAWAERHGLVAMPVDAVLLGTVTMACAEACTSPQVKEALAAAGGTDAWVPTGAVVGGVTSGKSQLDADIHYLENAAARCGRLLDAVAGDAEAIAARREEIIAALNDTSKPYFGDFLEMSWSAILARMLELMANGRHGRYEDGIWPDVSFRQRFADVLRMAESRLLGVQNLASADSVLTELAELDAPDAVLQRFNVTYPEAASATPHPVDEERFIRSICARPGKPVSFVPTVDADVRRWFKSDSLWHAHDDRLPAERVLTIPGPEAVRGIRVANEPVADCLERFHRHLADHLQATGLTPSERAWLKQPRETTAPAGVRVQGTSTGELWTVTAPGDADAWFGAVASRHDGAVARVWGARTAFEQGQAIDNPLRSLCAPSPGDAIDCLLTGGGALSRVEWHRPLIEGERLVLEVAQDDPTAVTLSLFFPGFAGGDCAPLRRAFTVDAAGQVHIAPLTAQDVRQFYHHNLFGGEQPQAALFEEVTDEVVVDGLQQAAYKRLSEMRGGEAASGSQVFSFGFRAMMRALCSDELAGGLLSLVHLEHGVTLHEGWPARAGETLQVSAEVTRVSAEVGGARVAAEVRLLRGEAVIAEAHEAFFLRGFEAPWSVRADERLTADVAVSDEAAAKLLSELDGVDWLRQPVAGEGLRLTGALTEVRSQEAVSFGADLTWLDAQGGTIGQWSINEGHEPAHKGQHPATAIVELLQPAAPADGAHFDLAAEVIVAPSEMTTWSEVSGDANPIHRSALIAKTVGLDGPIVHGMWTAARARAFAVQTLCPAAPTRLLKFAVSFVAPLPPGVELELRATRVGAVAGAHRVRVEALTLDGPVLRAEALVAPPKTAYAFPGQGIQQPGMGMDGYARSRAARAVWDAADAFTRRALGFSLLRVVRDNPKEMICRGRRDVHDKGVLYLTQYTQVAMATLARAQVAELREAGALAEDAVICGHSIGEYNALSAVADVLPLETVVAVVWHRGLTMHTCVPRDAEGRSGYAMGVIRPHHAGLNHDQAIALVEAVREETNGFVEIVNFNVAGRQYSTVGDLPTLAVLEERLVARRRPGGKPPWLTVPGIDVPFHSTRLRDGVPAFRATLERLLPDTGYLGLVGRYIPNLVAVPFALTPAFIEEMVAATDADEVKELRAAFADDGALQVDAERFARKLVVELFAFQFASPVRWIESQSLMFRAESEGGLGVERLVEIGVGYQPTIANMAHQTLAAMKKTTVSVVNMEAAAGEVLLTGARELPTALSEPEPTTAVESAEVPSESTVEVAAAVAAAPAAAPVALAPASAQAAPTDRPVAHVDALRVLLALQAKLRPEQIGGSETIDDVFGGVSSRRNQALVDIGAEFDAGAIDGAHEMPIDALGAVLKERASGWKSPGGYLRKTQDEAVRRIFGRAGLSTSEVSARLESRYGLGAGLVQSTLNFLSLVDRAGDSARGGALGALAGSVAASASEVDALLDQVTAALGGELGVVIAPLGGGETGGGAAVDATVVAELESAVLGAKGVLAGVAEDLRERLRPYGEQETGASDAEELEGLRQQFSELTAEHGDAWLNMVRPAFSAQKHIALTSAWAWARRDVARLYHDVRRGALSLDDAGELAAKLARFAEDDVVADRARFLAARADAAGAEGLRDLLTAVSQGESGSVAPLRPSRPRVYLNEAGQRRFEEQLDEQPDAVTRLLRGLRPDGQRPHVDVEGDEASAAFWQALTDSASTPFSFDGRTALVTGASPGSIAIEVVRHLLRGGARVVVTTSSLRRARAQFYRDLYQAEAAPGAELHVVPFNQASVQDVSALIDWLFERVTEPDGANVRELKPPFAPDIVVPFAALGDMATTDQLGPRSEAAIRVMLTGVERLVAGIGARYVAEGVPERLAHMVLPLSPNHGGFGGDGAYAETKAGLEVLLNKWRSESDAWGAATSLCAATIGWVRGTGLMDANDGVAADLEARTGARTFANAEMGWFLAALCTDGLARFGREAPVQADLTGGFGRIGDVRQVVGDIRADLEQEAKDHRAFEDLKRQLGARLGEVEASAAERVIGTPAWPMSDDRVSPLSSDSSEWAIGAAKLEDTVVVVGLGEIGPCGSGRTRWALEVEDELSPAAVLELAWMCGLVRWQDTSRGGGWIDVESEESVAESEIASRYGETVRTLAGVRWTEPEMAGFDADDVPVLATAWLDRDFTFDVASEEEAQAFVAADPEHTRAHSAGGRWSVTRLAGAEVRVPRQAKLNRRVLGMIPTGFSYGRMGLPGDLIEAVDRVTLMNLVATADAFLDAGITPEELLANVHPAHVANTQGSGLGGMQSLKRLFTDHLLDRERQGDIVQEMLINVVAAYAVQSYVGSYGGMVHPVGACATAAVSLEEGLDKILSGRARFTVSGGFDDVTAEGVMGFSDMQATADTAKMTAMGLDPDQMSRANDMRRRGFVEGQGGGTVLLCRGDVAAELGLPVRGVLAWAGSFSDGIHTSIPAPGLGVVAAAMGGADSPLGEALARFGLSADDIALVYKHDTSTAANDPNENLIHNTIQRALGRTPGNPLWVVSQKTLTGHAKGGAAAFQTVGICQAMAQGRIAGNRNLESVDPAMRRFDAMTFTDRALESSEPLRAGLVTSLGFGHVGAIALLLHPAAFEAVLAKQRPEALEAWRKAAEERLAVANRYRVDVLRDKKPLFERRSERPIPAQAAELAMLLDPKGRIEVRK